MPEAELSISAAATRGVQDVLSDLGSGPDGLTRQEAGRRLLAVGPNAVRTHRANGWLVLLRQLRSPILILLFTTATVSLFLADATNAVVIGGILLFSVGLGFINEYRADRAAEAMHSKVKHRAVVVRDGVEQQLEVVDLVPGDLVRVNLGTVIPADLRVVSSTELQCDESILTGESLPTAKDPAPIAAGAGDQTNCLFMGTVVQSGSGTGVVVATGSSAVFGHIALALGDRQPQTEFQLGLKKFSLLLLQVAIVLTTLIFVANLLLHRPILDSLLFSLAIAVGITPQLLPAVVSTSLATGTRLLASHMVLVKRLVSIEDLGDMDLLVTDKTGTLTDGRISFVRAIPADENIGAEDVLILGLLATEADYSRRLVSAAGQNPLDAALWDAVSPDALDCGRYRRLDLIPFDHQRRMTSALVHDDVASTTRIIAKGSPEDVLARCLQVEPEAQRALDEEFDAGARVVAVATRAAAARTGIEPADERDLVLAGFLVFMDRPKEKAKDSLAKLAALGVTVKIATGDNARVAEKVCAELGMKSTGTVSGAEMESMSDEDLTTVAHAATVFARVSPDQKARLISALRGRGHAVGFLGDGVNDALALHKADLGISVDGATDVAKDAADIILLDKDLDVLAEGIAQGRRIFANTMKYVLMGTSSNFGNMFSAAIASVALSFLPMLPGQILLNNLLYDTGQLAIPTDNVDKEQLLGPSHWNITLIRRFMLVFGPISSLFDFATFALMLYVFHAAPGEFRAGWFVESIATQTLIIFAIRTRRVPFLRSRPSAALIAASFAVVAVGVYLPLSPLQSVLGFDPLPAPFLWSLLALTVVYLVLVEIAKARFFARPPVAVEGRHGRGAVHHVARRAARFSTAAQLRRTPARGRA